MQQVYEGQVEVVGVGGGSNSIEEFEHFVATYGAQDLTHLADLDGSVWQRYGVTSQQTFVLIDDDGSVDFAMYSIQQLHDRVGELVST